ncbi:MAG: hypothetical protein NTW21_11185, partial [Verrucomicrobia bacterium]|nr:hypothetical protein [Verrucomicrobiota bacterium]
MAESLMAESFFKSLEGDSSLVGLSACGCAQTGVDPMLFPSLTLFPMILPSMILPHSSLPLPPSAPSAVRNSSSSSSLQRFGICYYSGSKEFMAESLMAESFFKSLEGDSSRVGLSACGCA